MPGMPVFSFRTRLLFVVLAVAILPLAVIGLWLTRSVSSSGDAFVRARLDATVNGTAARIGQRWIVQRSLLLDRAADPALQAALDSTATVRIEPYDGSGALTIPVALPVYAGALGPRIGTLNTALPVAMLLDDARPAPGVVGAVIGVYDAVNMTPLVPLPFDVSRPVPGEVSWGGERWLVAARELTEPSLLVLAGAPISPLAAPFERAARDGIALLAFVGLAGVLLAVLITTRMTRSLQRLAAAADAVAGGALDLTIEEAGPDEVGRVARAFNRMTRSLRQTLQELADHRALAAVGEFAAALAHEIRNPLSAIRVDLQVVEEALSADAEARRVQSRALAHIRRLDATLSGALATARAGRLAQTAVPLAQPLQTAIAAARATEPGTAITFDIDVPAVVPGDAAALQQLFLNLLLNAVQAAGSGGNVHVRLARVEDDVATVTITDDGPGIPAELRAHVFEPLVSTRHGGTGLGLTIAARIARAHGGALELLPAEAAGHGTTARVRLPAYVERSGSPGHADTAQERL